MGPQGVQGTPSIALRLPNSGPSRGVGSSCPQPGELLEPLVCRSWQPGCCSQLGADSVLPGVLPGNLGS